MKPEDCILIPKQGVGPVRFGQPLDTLENIDGFEKVDPSRIIGNDEWYECESCDVTVFGGEDGNVEFIGCDETLLFDGKNLVGLKLKELEALLKLKGLAFSDSDEMADGSTQTGVSFEPFGLTAWVSDGQVVSITVNDGDYED